jgi:hypothetical protein
VTLARNGRAALTYPQAFGWAVFPLQVRGKVPIISREDGGQGVKDATADPDRITEWWSRWPRANVAIATGAASGFWVVDIDPRAEGDTAWFELCRGRPELPDTVTACTGGGGLHILFAGEAPCGKLADGVDLKGTGGYIVAPPSIHPNGKPYCWEISSRPDETPIAEAPAWLREMAGNRRARPHYEHTDNVDAESFALGAAFKTAGWLGEQVRPGVFSVICPNRASHTSGRDYDTSTVIFAPRPGMPRGMFWCSHGHCQGLYR